MDQKNLRIIFNAYIENFEKFNNDEHREYMKWKFAKAFSEFDFNTPSRYELLKGLHPDNNYHILAFDIIYTSQVYRLYNLVEKKPMDSASQN